MASGVSLSAAAERKLRPVYDQLDYGNNKNALHEVEKILKKQKDFPAAKVLKCIALQRLGRREDAFTLAKLVTEAKPSDENSLQGLSLFFREINKVELIPPIYEAALKAHPSSEEYTTHLFMAYLRLGRLKNMQKTAMSLYKMHPKNPYLFWAVMSIVMQADKDPKLGPTMFLPLAEKMVEKQLANNSHQFEAAEIRLYLMILDMLGKHEKALEIVKMFKAKLLECDGSVTSEIEICKKLSRWEQVNKTSKAMLKINPNTWNHSLDYLQSLFHLVEDDYTKIPLDQIEGTSGEDSDQTLTSALQFISKFIGEIMNEKDTRKYRGPLLLRLEFQHSLSESKQKPGYSEILEQLPPLATLLDQYIELFGHKQCCYSDVAKYVSSLSVSEINQFLSNHHAKLKENLSEQTTDNRTHENNIQRDILIYLLERHCGVHSEYTKEEKLKLVTTLLEKHKHGIKFSADRPDTDYHTADAYCVLAADIIFDIVDSFDQKGESERMILLWRVCLMLEFACIKSPFNYRIKFLLIRAYIEIGLFQSSAHVFESLEIKHMQQDTLGYTVYHYMSALGHYQLASQAFEIARSYFTTNKKDLLEFVIACFKNGTFHKVMEFLSYQDTVERSLTSAFAMTEHAYMDLVTQANIELSSTDLLKTSVLPKSLYDVTILSDNRDFTVMQDISPQSRSSISSDVSKSFEYEKSWVYFRDVTVRCISCVLHGNFSNVHVNGDSGKNKDVNTEISFENLLKSLESICEKNKKIEYTKFSLHGPPNPRMPTLIEAGLPDVIVTSLKLSDLINRATQSYNEPTVCDEIIQYKNIICDLIKSSISGCTISGQPSPDDSESKNDCFSQANITIPFAGNCNDYDVTDAFTFEIPQSLIAFNKSTIERLVISCEMFSVCVLLIHSVRALVQRVKAEGLKRKRRKKGGQEPMPRIVETYKELVSSLLEVGGDVKIAVNNVLCNVETITASLKQLSIDDDSKDDLKSKTQLESLLGMGEYYKGKPIKILSRNASQSLYLSTNQLMCIVEGRIKNLKDIKI